MRLVPVDSGKMQIVWFYPGDFLIEPVAGRPIGRGADTGRGRITSEHERAFNQASPLNPKKKEPGEPCRARSKTVGEYRLFNYEARPSGR